MKLTLSRSVVQSDFIKKVEEISGQNILARYQCGKCSAGCPSAEEMDILPNQIIRLVQLGQEEQLEAFVGKYELNADFILHIIRESDQLYIHPTGQSKSQLFASSESKFYSKIVNAQITFNKDDSGKVVSLTLHQWGDHEAPKID